MSFGKKRTKKPLKGKKKRDAESDASVNSEDEDGRMQQAEATALLEEKYERQGGGASGHMHDGSAAHDSDFDDDLGVIARHGGATVPATNEEVRAPTSRINSSPDADINSLLSHFESSVGVQDSAAALAVQTSKLEAMSAQGRRKYMHSHHPEMLPLIQDMQTAMDELLLKVEPLTSAAQTPAADSVITPRGIQFLECKNQLLLSYLTNLSYYILLKAHGVCIKRHPVIAHLIELRLLIEKLRPVEKRMRGQVDKILTLSDICMDDDTNNMRPRPEMLMTARGMREDVADFKGDGGDVSGKAEGVYKPPKLVATEYTGKKLSERAKVAQMLERQKDKLQRSAVIRRMREELGEVPTEVGVGGVDVDDDYTEVDGSAALLEMQRRREEEELDNMARMAKSSKETKALRRLLSKKSQFGGGATIGDLVTMADEAMDGDATDPSIGGAGRVKPKTALARYVASARRAADLAEKGRRVADGDKHVKHREEGNRFVERVKVGGGDESGSEEEEEIIDDLASKLKRRRATTDAEMARVPKMDDDVEGRRKISRTVEKNRGLRRKRQKHESNPRVHNRVKYERRLKKHKRLHPDQKPQPSDGGYAGEHTGIRSKVARSTKLA